MQPPPRKGNYAKFLKNLHTEQINKLLLKNQHECDLLEDIRTFVIKRSAIEKSYSEALLKISSAYLNKKIPNIPDIKLDGGDEKWNMWNVWRTVLEENEKLARARLAAIEVFQQQIADDAKLLRAHKMQMAKKCVDHLAIAQKELQNCVQEVDKTKKLYFDEEHGAHEVRDKARDIEEKLKKKKGSFFQSITSLQKNSAKFSTKRDQLEEKSTGARNDYLLCLAAANAHQTRYFVVDLQQCMQAMESGVYEKVAEYLTLMGRTELLTCSAMQNSYSTIRDQAKQLTREYNLQCCYLFYPVLKQHITYDFDRCDNDPVDKVSAPVSAECQETLAKEARRWATRIARDVNTIRECTRKLQMYNSMREQGQKTDPNDPNGPDLETKIDDLNQNIRRAETSKTKAEARIECLRQGGVNVDECMREAESLNVQDIQRSASSLSDHPSSDSYYDSDFAEGDGSTVPASTGAEPASTRRDSSDDEMVRRESQSEHQYESADVDAVLDQERQRIENLTAGWEDPTQVDWGTEDSAETETAESVGSAEKRASVPLLKCTALYSYTAQHPDELTIVENEQLEVVGEGDGDGWLRARNYRGEEGFVPQNYLDIEREPPVTSASGTPALVNQISFSSVDYTVDNDDTQRQAETATQSPEQISVISAGKGKEEEKREATEYCVAMYDYVGEADDELTFEEGQVIRILSRQAHSVDDGWWKGELLDDGIVGNFPSLVVEESDEYGQMLEDPEWDEDAPLSTPPVPQWSGVPPDVVPSLPSDGMDTLEDDIVSSPPQQPPPAPPPEVLEELAALEAMKALDDSPITNGFTHQDAFSEETEASKPQQPPAVQPPAQSTSSTSKTAQQKQQGFEMKMTRDQHHQYGSQFDGGQAPPPSIPVIDVPCVEVVDEDAEETSEEPPAPPTGGDDFGLCAASIVITAATPMIEEAETPFPPVEESAVNHTDEAKSAQTSSSVPAASSTTESDIVDKPNALVESKSQSEEVEEMAASTTDDHQNFAVSSSTGSDGETTGPSTAENSVSQAPPAECDSAPKQVVGGRASIPDELEPHQLARLQDLKESNA